MCFPRGWLNGSISLSSSPRFACILLVTPLSRTVKHSRNRLTTPLFKYSWPARLPAHLCLLNKTSISDLKEPFLNSSCWAFPQPVDPTGVPPVVERRNEAAAYCHITESEVIHVFTLLHDYVQFNISHSSAEENTVSSSLCSLYQFPIIRFFHNTPIILIFTVKY